jgi:hypothetical protein
MRSRCLTVGDTGFYILGLFADKRCCAALQSGSNFSSTRCSVKPVWRALVGGTCDSCSDSGKKKFSGRPPDAERNYHGCGIPATVRGIGLIRKSEDKKTPPPQIANPIERLTEQMYVERMKYYASPKQRSKPK